MARVFTEENWLGITESPCTRSTGENNHTLLTRTAGFYMKKLTKNTFCCDDEIWTVNVTLNFLTQKLIVAYDPNLRINEKIG